MKGDRLPLVVLVAHKHAGALDEVTQLIDWGTTCRQEGKRTAELEQPSTQPRRSLPCSAVKQHKQGEHRRSPLAWCIILGTV